MRTLSTPAFDAIRSEETDEIMLVFLELEFPGTTIYVVNNTESIIKATPPSLALDIVESGTYQWTISGLGNNIYYLEANGGGDPGIDRPDVVYEDADGTPRVMDYGDYSPGYWIWEDHDILGFLTVYVRLTDEVDPDTKPDGYLAAGYGFEYLPYKFDIGMPDETDEGIPSVPLTIDNIDGVLMQQIALISEPFNVIMTLSLASSPHIVEAGPFIFKMIGADWSDELITGKLTFDDVMIESYPGYRVTPNITPAAF